MGRDCETSVARQPVSFYLSGDTAEAQKRHRDKFLKEMISMFICYFEVRVRNSAVVMTTT